MPKKEKVEIESFRFTTLSEFVRELKALLEPSEQSDDPNSPEKPEYIIVARVADGEIERLEAEFGATRALGRLKVKIQKADA